MPDSTGWTGRGGSARLAIGVGIIGYGKMGIWHARRAEKLPGFRLHGVFDILPARRKAAEQAHDCRASGALNEFLDDDKLDLAVVATPSHAHVEPVVKALQAGKHVLIEKPIAQTERDARRMFAAAEKAGRVLMTFQNRRFDSDFLTTRKAVESGKLGRIYDLRLIRWEWTRLMQTFGIREYRPQWRSEAAYGGGVLLDFGPHHVDQLLQLISEPVESVFGMLQGRRWTRDADDQFLAVLKFSNGVNAIIEYSQNAHVGVDVTWAVNGAAGGYRYAKKKGFLYARTNRGTTRIKQVQSAPEDWDALYRNFRDVFTGQARPLVRPAETLRLMRVLDALRRSAETGRVISVNDEFAPRSAGWRPAKSR